MFKYIYLLTATLFTFYAAPAQSVDGTVTDPTGTPNAYAAIRLIRYSGNDSIQVAGNSADDAGKFVFNEIAAGDYRIKAALVGFQDILSPVFHVSPNESKTLQPLQMEVSTALKEVVITATKPLIEVLVDKTVINVEGTALSAGNSVLDILQRAPGVVVTPQEQINLAGKGAANVMIDGKPLQLSDTELAAYLRGLSSDAVKSIELIANPSAKYDAQGTAGIVNIRLKKNQNFGMKGSASMGYAQSIHHRFNTGINLNYRPGPVNFFLNTNILDAAQTVEQKIDRYQNGKHFDQSNPEVEHWNSQFVKTGADWYLNDFHTIGVMVTGSKYEQTTRGFNSTSITDILSGINDSTLTSQSKHPGNNQRLNYNINYRFADTLGHEWSFDADRIIFNEGGTNNIDNQFFNAALTLGSSNTFRSELAQNISIWAFKSDFAVTKKNGLKIEAGAKATFTTTENNIAGANNFGEGFQPDPGRTNAFDLDETIAAGYSNISKSIKKWSFQAGLRAERTDIKGVSTDLYGRKNENPDTAYTGLFPSAFVQYQAAENHQLGFSANRRLERPAYQDLNPFIWQIDPYTSQRGNPYLRPAYAQSAELKYAYKQAASIAVSYTKTNDINQTIVRTIGNEAWTQPFNIAGNDNISINISAPLPIAKWWEGYLWLGIWHNQFSAVIDNNQLRTGSWGGSFWTGQQIKLGKGFQGDISIWAQFPTKEGVFTNKGIATLDLGIKKTFLNGKATVKLAVNDVLGTQHWTQTVDFAGLQGRQRNDWESQSVAVRCSWNFGNEKVKTRDRDSGNSDADNRIKKGKNQ